MRIAHAMYSVKKKNIVFFFWYFWNDAILRFCQTFKLFIATTLFSRIVTYEAN